MTYLLIILGAIIGWQVADWRGHKHWLGVLCGALGLLPLILLLVIAPKKATTE